MSDNDTQLARQTALERVLAVWIVTGLLFMLAPGTFLGVWNLVSITGNQSAATIPPAWIQAHGHAQLFGWIGSFIIGIGFYSLSRMARLAPFHVTRPWWSWSLWTLGVALRWVTNLYGWHWRELLPVSAVLELVGFAIFFMTVSRHESKPDAGGERAARPIWFWLVVGSTAGFLVSLLANLASTLWVTFEAKDPAVPHGFDQQLLTVYLWAFIVPAVWGFSARWLPGFLRLPQPSANALRTAGLLVVAALAAALFGAWLPSCFLATAAALVATFALHLPQRAAAAPDLAGVHFTFPYFIRVAYAWLVIGSCLSVWAAISDRSGGIWGASRHALTVGFISTMVFSIGQRVLPGFCGTRVLFSRSLMFLSLALLTVGCAMRVAMEPLAYEGYVAGVWRLLPVSATIELTAFTIFAVNLGMSLTRQPERIRLEPRATPQRLRVNGEY